MFIALIYFFKQSVLENRQHIFENTVKILHRTLLSLSCFKTVSWRIDNREIKYNKYKQIKSCLLRPDIEHTINYSNRDAENSKNKWLLIKMAELQTLADSKDPRGFYQNMRAVWRPRVNYPEQLLALNNKTIIREKH